MHKFEINSGLFPFIYIAVCGGVGDTYTPFPGLSFNIGAVIRRKFGCFKSIGRKRIRFLSNQKRGHISEYLLQKRHGWRKNCLQISE